MSEKASIEPELRETLVAYLDGELDAEGERRVEQLLSTDERVRIELQRLQSTWDLLDRLPRAAVGAEFTHSTVEMVALSVEQEARPAASRFGRRVAIIAVALAVACLSGFIAVRLSLDPNQRLLGDLPIVEHLEAYRQTPDIGFLRQLDKAGVFAEESSLAAQDTIETNGMDSVLRSREQRRAAVEALPVEQKQELLRKFERFEKLPSAERHRLRQLEAAVATDLQAASLYSVVDRYQHWLDQLAGFERAELMALSDEARLARVKQLRADEERRLSHDDQTVFAEWVEQKLLERMRPAQREQAQRLWSGFSESRRRQAVGQALRLATQPGRARPAADRTPDLKKKARPKPFWNPAAREELAQRLSPRGRQQLEEADGDPAQRKLIQSWAREVFYTPGGRGLKLPASDVDDQRLKEFFEQELDAAERAHLLGLPSDQMRRQLRRLYQRAHPR
ncbi:MAG TPA: hypothetical protein VJ783_13290 [Pirellulales bacterium]|nr:hypothetical protein [Pirellulales bacterium]